MADRALKLAVFASGRGSNFKAILEAVHRDALQLDVVLCLSDREDAGALEYAVQHGVPSRVIQPKSFASEPDCANAMLRALEEHEVNFIALAGYMRKIAPAVTAAYNNRIVNIHPALLPAFGGKGMYGRRVHEAVIEYGVHWTGATVHLVDDQYDNGPIVLQEPVPVLAGDNPDDVAARVLEVEHRLYPAALRLFADGRIRFEGRRAIIDEFQESRDENITAA